MYVYLLTPNKIGSGLGNPVLFQRHTLTSIIFLTALRSERNRLVWPVEGHLQPTIALSVEGLFSSTNMAQHITFQNDEAFSRTANEYHVGADGLTKREYFAALCFAAILQNPANNPFGTNTLANDAVISADALIAALNAEATK